MDSPAIPETTDQTALQLKQEQKKTAEITQLICKYEIALKQSRSKEFNIELQKRYEDKAFAYKKELAKYGVTV